jgi:hypothetical protein
MSRQSEATTARPNRAIKGGRVVFEDVIKQYYEETNKQFGTSFEPPTY